MKKTRLFLTVVFAMSILAVLSFSGCEEFDPDYTVKYEITGPATVAYLIQYRDGSGRVNTINKINIPWSKALTFKGNSNPSFSVHFDNTSFKTYTAKIYVNGKVKDSSTGSGDNIMASCLIN